MKTPWQVIQRQNKSALLTGTATHAIPSYVAPEIAAFYIHHFHGCPDQQPGETNQMITGGTCYFFLGLDNPDAVPLTSIAITNPSASWASLEAGLAAGTIVPLGSGYLLEVTVSTAGTEYTPEITVGWDDPSSNPQTDTMANSNGFLVVSDPAATLDPATVYVGESVTATIGPAAVVYGAVVDWGD